MEIKVLNRTALPIETISLAAGTSYGKENISRKRVETCINNGHLSVLEHVSITWKVSGISRSCSHQLVRHRLASYTEKSLRYTEPDLDGDDWYVIPESFKYNGPFLNAFKFYMDLIRMMYLEYIKNGAKKEDARFVLPLATKTDITITMNLREFVHFYNLRSDKNAQWEIRGLAEAMFDSLYQERDGYDELLNMIFGIIE